MNADKLNMDELIESLSRKFNGRGHYRISINIDGEEFSTLTTDMMAIDAAFDDEYDDVDDSGRYYENQREAQEALVNEIIINTNNHR